MKDAVGSVQSVLLVGGTSEIGLDVVRSLVADRARTVVLAARDTGRAEQAAAELRALGAAVEVTALDAARPETHAAVIRDAFARPEGIDVVLVAAGLLGPQGDD